MVFACYLRREYCIVKFEWDFLAHRSELSRTYDSFSIQQLFYNLIFYPIGFGTPIGKIHIDAYSRMPMLYFLFKVPQLFSSKTYFIFLCLNKNFICANCLFKSVYNIVFFNNLFVQHFYYMLIFR